MSLQILGSVIGCGLIVAVMFYAGMALEREAEKLKDLSKVSDM